MKKLSVIAVFAILCVAALLLQGCSAKQAAPVTGPKQQTQTVTTGPGEVFTVDLPSNERTGYEWALTKPIDTSIVTVEGNTYIAGPDKPGTLGRQLFRFKAIGDGTTMIPLEYIQPWRRNKPAKSYIITVNVAGGETGEVKQYNDPGVPVKTAVGQEFLIALAANPTSGYEWQMAGQLDPRLKLVETSYSPEEGQMVDSAGTQYWRFEGQAPGMAGVTLNYIRPWEKGVPPSKTETFTVNIQ